MEHGIPNDAGSDVWKPTTLNQKQLEDSLKSLIFVQNV